MRHVVFLAPGELEWRDAPDPRVQGVGEAIVRTRVIGRCDLDRHYLSGRMPLAAGEPIGHEIIGEITDLGEGAARHFAVGQRVIVPAQISCGNCAPCRRGSTGRCEAVPLGASYGMGRAGGFGGGLADFVRAPFASAMLVPLPAHADPVAMIGLADMATDSWRAVAPQLAMRPGGRVLVIGGATPVIGLYAAALAVCFGAGVTDYVDPDAARRAVATSYGAGAWESTEAVPHAPYDILVDAASDPDVLVAALRLCAPDALVTSVAPPFTPPPLAMLELYYKGVSWRIGRPDCRAAHDGALHAWAAKGFRPELVGPKAFAYGDAIEAWLDPALYVAAVRTD